MGPGESITIKVTNIAGLVPANNVDAVTLNLTAVEPTLPGYLTVYPAGSAFPPVSNVNFAAGQTVPNHVMVGVSPTGEITIFNSDGNTHVLVDVVGWFGSELAAMGAGFVFIAATPMRILDTRADVRLAAGAVRDLVIPGASTFLYVAAVMNVTVVNPAASGFLTVFPKGDALPNASTNNFVAGQTLPNLVTVKIGAAGSVTLYNGSSDTIDLVVDLQGSWSPPVSIPGTVFKPNPGGPTRIYDSRISPARPLAARQTVIVPKPTTAGVVVRAQRDRYRPYRSGLRDDLSQWSSAARRVQPEFPARADSGEPGDTRIPLQFERPLRLQRRRIDTRHHRRVRLALADVTIVR